MTATELALRLRHAGLRWHPARGDRFFLPHRNMDDEVFVISDMTVELHEFPTGKVIGFNGVTEWALDSVDVEEAVWVPVEGQLRGLLGGLFVRLERVDHRWAVTVNVSGRQERFLADDADDAYAQALVSVLEHITTQSLPASAP